MHDDVILFMRGMKIEDATDWAVERLFEDFGDNFCTSLGEKEPKVRRLADWFEMGGRFAGGLKAKRGIALSCRWAHGYDEDERLIGGECNGCEVADLLEDISPDSIVVDNEVAYDFGSQEYDAIIAEINSKKADGVLFVLDCHS